MLKCPCWDDPWEVLARDSFTGLMYEKLSLVMVMLSTFRV